MVKVTIDASCLKDQGSGTAYDDTEVLNRIKALEGRTDNFVKDVTVSRDGNKVKLTYTRVDGSSSEVEFDDKDTVSVAYDDSALKARVEALEDKPDKDTVYDDTVLKQRVQALEDKVDKDTVTKVTSTTEGVAVTPTTEDNVTTYDVNMDEALGKFYKKAETYTKKEVDKLVKDQEDKATDLTVYKGTFTDKTKVKEGQFDSDRSPRITLTYSSSTGVGIFKIDFIAVAPVAWSTVIAKLPPEAPVPAELVETQVWIGDNYTSVWIDKGSRDIKTFGISDPKMLNKRIIISIPGIFKK